jgi:triosephosphate isomerase
MVCADSPEEAAAVAHLGPNIILAEPPELIGMQREGIRGESPEMEAIQTIKSIDGRIQVLNGAGIRTEKDVINIIRGGAEATGCTSGIIKADDPVGMMEKMIRALRETWDELHPQQSQ